MYWNTVGLDRYTENPILIRTVRRYGEDISSAAYVNPDSPGYQDLSLLESNKSSLGKQQNIRIDICGRGMSSLHWFNVIAQIPICWRLIK